MPLWGQDQNGLIPFDDSVRGISECPCGGKIKTHRSALLRLRRQYQNALVGARSKRLNVPSGLDGVQYQNALVGARSKRVHPVSSRLWDNIRMPLWGQDQNRYNKYSIGDRPISECPCGGKIKTVCEGGLHEEGEYQNALVGARSKPSASSPRPRRRNIRMPLWGQDQNGSVRWVVVHRVISECPCGGKIKTSGPEHIGAILEYQNALVGARSKRLLLRPSRGRDNIRMPLWGQDQNARARLRHVQGTISECPCGGKIKTASHSRSLASGKYQNALVGARSKRRLARDHIEEGNIRMPLWGQDQNLPRREPQLQRLISECPCGGKIKTAG